MMNKFEIRYARKVIKGKEYRFERMKRMNEETAYWMRCASNANNTIQRNSCHQMAKIYNRRYQYYLNQ